MRKKLPSEHSLKAKLEKIASEVDHSKVFNRYLILDALEISKNSSGKTALELGCGSGITTQAFSIYFERLVVVDGSETYLERAKDSIGENKNVEFICSFFEDLDFKEKFEDIIMAHILEHVQDPVYILEKAKNWLANQGRIHVIVPNGESIHRQLAVILGIMEKATDLPSEEAKRGHKRVYTKSMLENQIKKAGYYTTFSRGLFLKTFTNEQLKILNERYIDALFKVSENLPMEICAELYYVCQAMDAESL